MQRLIKEDLSAVHVSFKLLGEDEQRWEGEGGREEGGKGREGGMEVGGVGVGQEGGKKRGMEGRGVRVVGEGRGGAGG